MEHESLNHSGDIPPPYAIQGELLPKYTPSLSFFGLALMEIEFTSPYHSNAKRELKPVLLELNSTQLNLYELRVSSTSENLIVALYNHQNQISDLASNLQNTLYGEGQPLLAYTRDLGILLDDLEYENPSEYVKLSSSNKLVNKWKKHKTNVLLNKSLPDLYNQYEENKMLFEPTSSYEEYVKKTAHIKGKLLRSYTLANCKAGEAPSVLQMAFKEDSNPTINQNELTLVKSKNTLRLRLELNQILLQFWSFHAMINWYRNILIAKDLSTPIEERGVSKLKSIPTRYNRANNALLAAMALDSDYRNQNLSSYPTTPSYTYLASSKIGTLHCEINTTDESIDESIFTRNRSSSSSYSEYSVGGDGEIFYSEINKYKFISYERYYTPLEKQYISNCIPDLNTFDRWMGTKVTLSNCENYLNSKQIKDMIESKGFMDLFISLNKLENPKRLHHPVSNNKKYCREFHIDSKGLVSVTA